MGEPRRFLGLRASGGSGPPPCNPHASSSAAGISSSIDSGVRNALKLDQKDETVRRDKLEVSHIVRHISIRSPIADTVRVFKNIWFQRFARKERMTDASLCDAVARASAGCRTLVFFRAETRAIFAFGCAKSAKDNITAADQADLKRAAKALLSLSEAAIDELVARGTFEEVNCGAKGKAGENLQE